LLVTLDFRMSTTCMYSDIVLPTATWYEKNDLNTSDMHPFIHPLSAAVDPAWESRTDWDIFKGIAKAFSETCPGHLGVEKDIVALPTLHDTPNELAMPDVKDWKKGECDLIPGKTAPSLVVVERDYPSTYKKFTSVGPLLDKLGNGGKGIGWNTEHEVEALATLNYTVLEEGVSKGRPRIDSDIDAAEMIMMLAPETNGHVAVKAWAALVQNHRPRSQPSGAAQRARENPLPRHRGPAAQNHFLAHLVGAGRREGQLQRRLYQRP
jgi:nitrate reductase alpha subunit